MDTWLLELEKCAALIPAVFLERRTAGVREPTVMDTACGSTGPERLVMHIGQ